jgi:hypothetical protein
MCIYCTIRPIAPGKQKYCRICVVLAPTMARHERRAKMKAQGIPAWQRNGWASEEQYRQYHRQYMQERRVRK